MTRVMAWALSGCALAWAVGRAAFPEAEISRLTRRSREGTWAPHEDWAHGGPLIDQFDIDVMRDDEFNKTEPYAARTGRTVKHPTRSAYVWGFGRGPTKLVAAMRCLVGIKLGDSVNVPAEIQLVAEAPLMNCGNKLEFQQRLQWLSEGMLAHNLATDDGPRWPPSQDEIEIYRRFKEGT